VECCASQLDMRRTVREGKKEEKTRLPSPIRDGFFAGEEEGSEMVSTYLPTHSTRTRGGEKRKKRDTTSCRRFDSTTRIGALKGEGKVVLMLGTCLVHSRRKKKKKEKKKKRTALCRRGLRYYPHAQRGREIRVQDSHRIHNRNENEK